MLVHWLHSLSLVRCAVFPTQQPLLTRTNLVYAECQATVRNVATLPTGQASLAHSFAMMTSAAHGRPTISVNFTSGTWTKEKKISQFSFHCDESCHSVSSINRWRLQVWVIGSTFLPIGNAAVALPKHAAESTDTLGVPPTVAALPSQRNAKTKVSITGQSPPTGPVMVTHSLGERGGNIKTLHTCQSITC